MGPLRRRIAADPGGVHLALNVFVATTLLWFVIQKWAGLNPIWAISAMLASSDAQVSVAFEHVRSRLINAALGCTIGLTVLLLAGALGGSRDWKLPLALATTAFISSYIVRVPVMWRQAPITAAIVVASGIEHHSEKLSIEIGLRRVAEVLFGCLVGLAVSWVLSKLWPLPEPPPARSTTRRTFECTDFQTEIEAPAERVFETLKDLASWSRWTRAIKNAWARSPGPWRRGYKFVMRTSITPAPLPMTVYELEENRLIAWGVKTPLFTVLHRIRFEPLGPNRCRVRNHEFVEGPLARLVGSLLAGRIDRFDRQFAADLAAFASAAHVTGD